MKPDNSVTADADAGKGGSGRRRGRERHQTTGAEQDGGLPQFLKCWRHDPATIMTVFMPTRSLQTLGWVLVGLLALGVVWTLTSPGKAARSPSSS